MADICLPLFKVKIIIETLTVMCSLQILSLRVGNVDIALKKATHKNSYRPDALVWMF